MTGFFIFLHAVISIMLLVIILMQSGRGGGLTESFASAESMFGAKTNEFMIKATTVFASLFLMTCLGLAIVSSQKVKSLMSSKVAPESLAVPTTQDADAITDLENDIVIGGEDALEAAAVEGEPLVVDGLSEDLLSDDVPASVTQDDQ